MSRAARRWAGWLSLAAVLRWWTEDPDAVPEHPVMLGVRLWHRRGDGALSCRLLDPLPQRGQVVLHALLRPGATDTEIYGAMVAVAHFGNRRAPGRWAAWVTDGTLHGYVQHDSTRPLIERVAPRAITS